MFDKYLNFLRKPTKFSKISLVVLIASIILVVYLASASRFYQLSVWKQNENSFFASGTPMTTTLDAYKFFRHAKEYHAGIYDIKAKDPMIFYPERVDFPIPVPLISVVLDKFATLFSTDVYTVSLYMMPILCGVFVIPLAIYFFLLGYPALGIMGALVGVFAPMYAGRTALGRVDADSMILFFSFLASLFVLVAMKVRDKKQWLTYLYSALAGLSVGVFYYWYHHGAFTIAYFAILILMLAISRFKIKYIAISAGLFILCSNPIYFTDAFWQMVHSINTYLFPITKSTSIFPNVYSTISEAQKSDISESLGYVIGSKPLVVSGLIGAVLFAIAHFKKVIPLAPVLILGMMTFTSSSRFSMFLGPTVGVGLGYIIHFAISYLKLKVKHIEIIKLFATYAVCYGLFTLITIFGGNSYRIVPGPSIQPVVFQYFKDMKTVLPPDSNIYTWWDFGLAITDTTGFKVFHSGMTQETPKTYLIAKSLSSDQKGLYNIASYLDTHGIRELDNITKDNKSLSEIMGYISSFDKGPVSDRDYILFTSDMIEKYSAITYLATWNDRTKSASPRRFDRLSCSGVNDQGILSCANGKSFNLFTGVSSSGEPLVATYHVEVKQREKPFTSKTQKQQYGFSSGKYLIIVQHRYTEVYLLDKELFDSPFVQLFILNEPDTRYFEAVKELDLYPFARTFRLKKVGESN